MTRQVMTGHEVPHIFAAQSQVRARSGNGSVWFEGRTLFSYREPIARFYGDSVLMSADSFSVTTSRHQSRARSALHHVEQISVPSLKALCEILDHKSESRALEYIKARMARMAQLEESLKRMRAEWKIRAMRGDILAQERACEIAWRAIGKRGDWRKSAAPALAKKQRAESKARYDRALGALAYMVNGRAQEIMAQARERANRENATVRESNWILGNALGDILRADSLGAVTHVSGVIWRDAPRIMGRAWCAEYKELAERLFSMAEPWRAENDARLAELSELERAENAERLQAWLACEPNARAPRLTEIACRVVGETVETTQGARVPLHDALRVVALAKACRESGKAFEKTAFTTGAYKGVKIDSAGNVTIGCHHLTWRAISECVALFKPEALA